jgi:large subunit ribosomal protein L5e
MPGKLTKGKAYFRRLQVKFKRRQEGKTDYQSRASMIVQDQRSINTPKHRFVVRRTNREIICQIVLSQITGDVCICSAYSHELTRYGIPVGHTNYAACYATGCIFVLFGEL